jgi:hypothetical protein
MVGSGQSIFFATFLEKKKTLQFDYVARCI